MNIDPKDPNLSAYALGEHEDGLEYRDIAKAWELSEELCWEVDEILETAVWVATELKKEPSPGFPQRIRTELNRQFWKKGQPQSPGRRLEIGTAQNWGD